MAPGGGGGSSALARARDPAGLGGASVGVRLRLVGARAGVGPRRHGLVHPVRDGRAGSGRTRRRRLHRPGHLLLRERPRRARVRVAPGGGRRGARLRGRRPAPGGGRRHGGTLGPPVPRRGPAAGLPVEPEPRRRDAGPVAGGPAGAAGRRLVDRARTGLCPHSRRPARHRAGADARRPRPRRPRRQRRAPGGGWGHRPSGAAARLGGRSLRRRRRGAGAFRRGLTAGFGQCAAPRRPRRRPARAGRPPRRAGRGGRAGLRERRGHAGHGPTRRPAAAGAKVVVPRVGGRRGMAARPRRLVEPGGQRSRRFGNGLRGLRARGQLHPRALDGRAAPRRPAFGWAAQYAVTRGRAALSLSQFPYVPIAVLVEVVAWVVLAVALLGRRRRRRSPGHAGAP